MEIWISCEQLLNKWKKSGSGEKTFNTSKRDKLRVLKSFEYYCRRKNWVLVISVYTSLHICFIKVYLFFRVRCFFFALVEYTKVFEKQRVTIELEIANRCTKFSASYIPAATPKAKYQSLRAFFKYQGEKKIRMLIDSLYRQDEVLTKLPSKCEFHIPAIRRINEIDFLLTNPIIKTSTVSPLDKGYALGQKLNVRIFQLRLAKFIVV